MTKSSRPRRRPCPACGEATSLVRCGVDAHRRTRTYQERATGRCTGHVYAHDSSGAIDTATCEGAGA